MSTSFDATPGATPGKLLYPWFVTGAVAGGLLLVPIAITLVALAVPALNEVSVIARVGAGLAYAALLLVAFTTDCRFRANLGGLAVAAAALAPQLQFKEGGAAVSLVSVALLLLTAVAAFSALMTGRSHL